LHSFIIIVAEQANVEVTP